MPDGPQVNFVAEKARKDQNVDRVSPGPRGSLISKQAIILMETDLRPILFGRHGGAVIEGMFRALCAYPYGLTNPQLRAAIYSPALEPEWSQSCIQVAVCRFNRLAKKRGLGLRIRGGGGPGSKYRLYLVKPGC